VKRLAGIPATEVRTMTPTWQANRAGLPLPAKWLLSLVLVAALGAALVRAVCGTTLSQAGVPDQRAPNEPATAAAFMASQRDRDTTTVALVTSPLYRAEMARRGRGTDWPFDGLWTEATAQLSFTFVGALSDSDGFTFALYTARAKHPNTADAPTSLWRIDLDPEGRVIWGELARIFDSPRVEVVRGPRALALANTRWQLLFAVRSAAGDAYVALHPDPADPGRIAFAQEDASGELGPSFWSFGQPMPTRDAQWHPVDPLPFDLGRLTVGQDQMLRSYLRVLDWSPAEAGSAR
jgi:hypothetical protein